MDKRDAVKPKRLQDAYMYVNIVTQHSEYGPGQVCPCMQFDKQACPCTPFDKQMCPCMLFGKQVYSHQQQDP